MIWHEEYCVIKSQPKGSSIRLVGSFGYEKSDALTQIYAEVILSVDQDPIIIKLYMHNPVSISYEEPEPDDVYRRYASKINKIKDRLKRIDYDELIKLGG